MMFVRHKLQNISLTKSIKADIKEVFQRNKKLTVITVLTFPNIAQVVNNNRSVTPVADLYDNIRTVQNEKFMAPQP